MNTTQNAAAPLGWVIDRDYLSSGTDSNVGKGQTLTQQDEGNAASVLHKVVNVQRGLSSGDVAGPVRFRLLDDDGEIYYGGAISSTWLDGDEEYAFAPLEWGTADSGCTEMQYRGADGEWQTL